MLRRHFSTSRRLFANLEGFNVFSTADKPQLPRIDKCRRTGINIAGVNLQGPAFLVNGAILLWDVKAPLKAEHFTLLKHIQPIPEILLLGTGKEMELLDKSVLESIRKNGIQVDVMNSRNACATYNVLVEEERNVALALLPIEPISARAPNLPPQE